MRPPRTCSPLSPSSALIAVREDVNLEPAFWAQFPGNFKDIGAARSDLERQLREPGQLPQFPHRPSRGQSLGRGHHSAGDHRRRPLLFQLPPRRSRQLHRHRAVAARARRWCSASCWRRRRSFRPERVYFDKDRGAEIFLRAIGGRYDVLRPGEPTGLNPLLLTDEPANRPFLADWTAQLISGGGEPLDAEDIAAIADAVDANFAQPPRYRRLRLFRASCSAADGRPSGRPGGASRRPGAATANYAWLFDNADDGLDLDARTRRLRHDAHPRRSGRAHAGDDVPLPPHRAAARRHAQRSSSSTKAGRRSTTTSSSSVSRIGKRRSASATASSASAPRARRTR